MKNGIMRLSNNLVDVLRNPDGTCRIVKNVGDGRLVILQVVNPGKDPAFAKWLRKKAENSRAMRLAHALEVAKRVGGYAFKNAMRKNNRQEDTL